jgi:uncharacterized membrane protein YphA (DoxX/SURF4 family)
MSFVQKAEFWRDKYQDSTFFAALRIVLGLILIYKGIYFLANTGEVQSVLAASSFSFGTMALAHYIGMVHLAGGFMIASGFLTRISILFQLPILIGAVLFVNARASVFNVYSEWLLSIIVLLMLLFFLYFGPGTRSLDVLLRRKRFYE